MSALLRRRGHRRTRDGYGYLRIRNWQHQRLTLHHGKVWHDAFALVREFPVVGDAPSLVAFWGVYPTPRCLFRRQREAMLAVMWPKEPTQ
jgi:hypothetical protein